MDISVNRNLLAASPPPGDFQVKSAPFHGLVGFSSYGVALNHLAAVDYPLLIQGEPGTGKRSVARAIHLHSARQHGPFVQIDCRAISKRDIEARLAGGQGLSLLQQAQQGTLFIGCIEELSARAQNRLLQALVLRECQPDDPADFRLMVSSRTSLEEAVARGSFNADLYYRVHVLSLYLSPLRDRPDDAVAIAEGVLSEFGSSVGKTLHLGQHSRSCIRLCNWPGNIHGLRSCILRAATVADQTQLNRLPCGESGCPQQAHWQGSAPPVERAGETTPPPVTGDSASAKARALLIDRQALLDALVTSGWVQAQAARRLGVTPRQVGYAIQKYGIEVQRC